MSDKKKMTASQALTIGAQIAGELEGLLDLTIEEAQSAIRNPCFVGNMTALLKNNGNIPKIFGRLVVIQLPKILGGLANGAAVVSRAREFAQYVGARTHGNDAHTFYKQKCNWPLLPQRSDVDKIFFIEPDFSEGEHFRSIRVLHRVGTTQWSQRHIPFASFMCANPFVALDFS